MLGPMRRRRRRRGERIMFIAHVKLSSQQSNQYKEAPETRINLVPNFTATSRQNTGQQVKKTHVLHGWRTSLNILQQLHGGGVTNIRILEAGLHTLPAPDDYLKATPDFILKYEVNGQEHTQAVECKCPYYGRDGKKAGADRMCRAEYILQTHGQTKAVSCRKALLVSWGPESTRVFQIDFSDDLWEDMRKWPGLWFGASIPSTKHALCQRIHETIKLRAKWASTPTKSTAILSARAMDDAASQSSTQGKRKRTSSRAQGGEGGTA
jgi:hypothetical protein